MRKQVIQATRLAVCIFLVMALLLVLGIRFTPALLRNGIESAIESGNTDRARRLITRLSGEEAAAYLSRCAYTDALAAYGAGEWDSAAEQFASLGDYEDAVALRRDALYCGAIALQAQGEWEKAAEQFLSVGNYKDASGLRSLSVYRMAEALEAEGNTTDAVLLFLSVADYEDAEARAEVLACAITGISDPAKAVNSLKGLDAAALERIQQLAALRERLPEGHIAAGFRHTVGLCSGGVVTACGSNEYGQCEVSGWTGITAVAAGAYHTVGLRGDGTVLACGRSTENQCEVSGWTNVTAIAACDYGTLGLCADGTVLYTGYDTEGPYATWSNVVKITGGSFDAGAIRADGTALFSHAGARSDEMTDLAALTVNSGFSVGVTAQGAVISPMVEGIDWNFVLTVVSTGNGILGIDEGGRVLSLWFRHSAAIDLSDITDAIAIASRGTHVVIMHEDGTVTARGLSADGQCDTAGWNLYA